MKSVPLYAVTTASHQPLFDRFFLPSLEATYEKHLVELDIDGSGAYMESDWSDAILAKIDLMIEASENHPGTWCVYSDVDLVFLGETWAKIMPKTGRKDMLFHQDQTMGHFCMGFFAFKGGPKVTRLFRDTRSRVEKIKGIHNQNACNYLLVGTWKSFEHLTGLGRLCLLLIRKIGMSLPGKYRKFVFLHYGYQAVFRFIRFPYGIRAGFLPLSFMGGGQRNAREAQGLSSFRKDTVMYHANYCVGVDAKVEKLKQCVRDAGHCDSTINIPT